MKIEQAELKDALNRIREKSTLALKRQSNGDAADRRFLTRVMREIGEIAGAFATVAALIAIAWAWMEVTPPQFDAEHDFADMVAQEAGE